METAAWQHEVREGLRRSLWRAAAAKRSDMQGIECGVDRVATLELITKKRTGDIRRGILRLSLIHISEPTRH
eukprot:1853678-Karenia_brevis.AAC.1